MTRYRRDECEFTVQDRQIAQNKAQNVCILQNCRVSVYSLYIQSHGHLEGQLRNQRNEKYFFVVQT